MITLTNEWMKVKQQADRQWGGERVSSGEIGRRYMLAGLEALKDVPEADRARVQHQFQASMMAKKD